MNQSERKQLKNLHQRLLDIASEAPTTSTYEMGRTSGSVKARIMEAAGDLAEIIADEVEVAPQQEEAEGEPA